MCMNLVVLRCVYKKGRIMSYNEFMYNEENIYNCECCPENKNFNSRRFPCGQQNCWVKVHCEDRSAEVRKMLLELDEEVVELDED